MKESISSTLFYLSFSASYAALSILETLAALVI
jgi:hypothetical protein